MPAQNSVLLPICQRFGPSVLNSVTLAAMLSDLYKFVLLLCLFVGGTLDTFAQPNGGGAADLALVHAFDRKDLGGGLMTTDIAVVGNERVVAANQSGVLVFDGGAWDLIPVPNRGVARSVLSTEEGVWVGGQGFLGRLTFGSSPEWWDATASLVAAGGDFGDVWRLVPSASGVFFGTSEFAGVVTNAGEVEVLVKGPIQSSFPFEGGFACQQGSVLHLFDASGSDDMTLPVNPQWRVDGYLPESNWLLTHADGMYAWNGSEWSLLEHELSRALQRARVNTVTESKGAWFIGTVEQGIYETHNWKQVAGHYHEGQGMAGTSVLGLDVDEAGNVWSANEGGVNVIRISGPKRVPAELTGLGEPGYTSLHVPDGQTFWGTSHGLKWSAQRGAELLEVPGLDGQIWSLQLIDGAPWVSHLYGAGWLNGPEYTPVIDETGVWEVVQQPVTGAHYAGSFKGVYRLDLAGGLPPTRVAGFEESSRFVVFEDERTLWVAHPYKGAFRVELDATGTRAEAVKLYTDADGLPSPVHVEVLDVEGAPLFSTNAGFYRFNPLTDRMEPAEDAFAGLIPPGGHVQRLYRGLHATWWYLKDQTVGQIHPHTANLNTSMAVRSVPLTATPMVEPFERLEILSDDRVCVPVETGFLYIDANRMASAAALPEVEVQSVLHLGHDAQDAYLDPRNAQLPAGSHALEIRLRGFDARFVGVQRFQWRLEELNAEWSRPQESARITLGGLGPGTHRFAFRAYVSEGLVGPSTEWTVRVAPPWHGRWDVRAGLLLLTITGAGWGVVRKQRALRKAHAEESAAAERKRMAEAEQYRRDLESSELRVEAERLRRVEAEMAAKNQELASATMHLVQKAQMANTLKSGLQSLREHLDAPQRKQVDRLLGVLGDGARLDDNWEQFTQQFDRVHVEFHQRLLDQFPDLTKNDLKLCTYLRMNLSSKEIASLTFVTVRAVEVSRSRLRKRLGLEPGENLLQFIQSL